VLKHTTINLNDGVDVAPRYHFVRLAACDTTPPPRMFGGVWYHATNMTCRLFIFSAAGFKYLFKAGAGEQKYLNGETKKVSFKFTFVYIFNETKH
jgi:hypothetical protein